MRRFLGALALTLFTATPLLQWQCLVDCRPSETAELPECHRQQRADDFAAGMTHVASTTHDCDDHISAEAGFAGSFRPVMPALEAPVAGVVNFAAAAMAASTVFTSATAPPGGPPGRFLLPLRV